MRLTLIRLTLGTTDVAKACELHTTWRIQGFPQDLGEHCLALVVGPGIRGRIEHAVDHEGSCQNALPEDRTPSVRTHPPGWACVAHMLRVCAVVHELSDRTLGALLVLIPIQRDHAVADWARFQPILVRPQRVVCAPPCPQDIEGALRPDSDAVALRALGAWLASVSVRVHHVFRGSAKVAGCRACQTRAALLPIVVERPRRSAFGGIDQSCASRAVREKPKIFRVSNPRPQNRLGSRRAFAIGPGQRAGSVVGLVAGCPEWTRLADRRRPCAIDLVQVGGAAAGLNDSVPGPIGGCPPGACPALSERRSTDL
mmetsp:Transcript_44031/g.104246  ORF Transcript_44031/g.104246 Transcript_44031/m.104246 type:complete len:313 (-) Transcript_44031:1133-2071(-)